jgi:opacity protein-like surface antigen
MTQKRSSLNVGLTGRALCGAMFAACALATNAMAQENAPAGPADEAAAASTWTLRVQPVVWYAGYSGKLVLPGQSAGSSKTTIGELDADNPRLTPAGSIQVGTGNWTFGVSGAVFSVNDRSATIGRSGEIGSIAYSAGDTLRSSMDFSTLEVTAAYRLGRWDLDESARGGVKVVPTLDVLGGIRMYDTQYDITRVGGGATSTDKFFAEPIAGVRGSLELAERFTVDVQLSMGAMAGSRETFSWDVMAGFSWHPVEHLGIVVGYRNLAFDLKSGDGTNKFRHDGAIAGLYFGVDVRF